MNKILMYHSIGETCSVEVGAELYAVAQDKFGEQVEYLAALPEHSRPELTFDDGLLNNYTNAYPMLKNQGMLGYFFIIAVKVGTDGYMNWQQIKELSAAGMVIGSHGLTHRILTTLNNEELDDELCASKELLEKNLGIKIDALSIPRGFLNARVIAQAKEAGYRNIFTSDTAKGQESVFPRIAVRASWSRERFIRSLSNQNNFPERLGLLAKKTSRQILGAGNYDKIRAAILKK